MVHVHPSGKTKFLYAFTGATPRTKTPNFTTLTVPRLLRTSMPTLPVDDDDDDDDEVVVVEEEVVVEEAGADADATTWSKYLSLYSCAILTAALMVHGFKSLREEGNVSNAGTTSPPPSPENQ